VQTPPDDLSEAVLASVLAREWGLACASMTYRPLGFGSHHWQIVDADGTRWFGTVDELETKRHSAGESLDTAFDRLRAALAAARALHDSGGTFALAPVPTRGGEPVVRMADRFGVALYPFVDGQSFGWGEPSPPAHRRAALDMVIAVHTAPAVVRGYAMADDFGVPLRDEMEAILESGDGMGNGGPYARPTARLLVEHAKPVEELLARYDELVAAARGLPDREVLTHGEPHPGNTMLTPAGWRLIDWDTVLVAPPERDLWMLDPGDGSILRAYAEMTGVSPLPSMIELYRIGWDLSDMALYVSRFRGKHTGSLDDQKSWNGLCSMIESLAQPRRH
jgi:spectinomycin phosphotransferase/16S rRNA (guanine(1405)-N(7))-methyltransferase